MNRTDPRQPLPGILAHIFNGILVVALGLVGCSGENPSTARDGSGSDSVPQCVDGVDMDGDGYGQGCAAGTDCNDKDPLMHPGQAEICDGKDNNCNDQTDEGVLNACGNCDPVCGKLGDGPLPIDPDDDPNVKQVNGVGLDPNGDLVLDKSQLEFNYMWIANTQDVNDRGTVSKIDTDAIKEVARYFTVTCSKMDSGKCLDINGKVIERVSAHRPSRTAVDFNFDVWVANRQSKKDQEGQPSVTRIANDRADCVDRNGNKKIDTSEDRDGNGQIELDCDEDGQPDNASTVCTKGDLDKGPPEFYGYDDECVLFTVNYADEGNIGRSVCLDSGPDFESNAWVGTYARMVSGKEINAFFRITAGGEISGPYNLPEGHYSYGCAVDSQGFLWSTAYTGRTLVYLDTNDPRRVAPALLEAPFAASNEKFYGISLDSSGRIWLGGAQSKMTFRYTPKRDSFSTLAQGSWMAVKEHTTLIRDDLGSRGVAADQRGRVWIGTQNGYVARINQDIPDRSTPYEWDDAVVEGAFWKTPGHTVIGVGVDFKGNVWGISQAGETAARLDVDDQGEAVSGAPAMTDPSRHVKVGKSPYTYSDFTGYGLRNFTRKEGRYQYEFPGCPQGEKAEWLSLSWESTTPTGTAVLVRVRSGDDDASMSDWLGPFAASPIEFADQDSALANNPARHLRVEFMLRANEELDSPVLHGFQVTYECGEDILH